MTLRVRRIVAMLVLGVVSGLLAQSMTPIALARPRELLTDNIVAYWPMDEASGVRYDSVASYDLSDTNTVGSAAGQIGNAADFERDNSEYLSHVDDGVFSPSGAFTFAGWVNFESDDWTSVILKADFVSDCEYVIYRNPSSDALVFNHYSADCATADSVSVPSLSLSTWHFVAAWYDAGTDEIKLQVDNGTIYSTASTQPWEDTDAPFQVSGLDFYMDGDIDELGYWSRALSDAERGYLYNGGAGCTYPFGACDATATPTATATATNTPTPTPTPTNTATATPPGVIIIISATPIQSSTPSVGACETGEDYTSVYGIVRTCPTYSHGDLVNFGATVTLVVSIWLFWLYDLAKSWMSRTSTTKPK